MDAERGIQFALLAGTGLLTFYLLLPYLTVILAAVLLAYLLSTPYKWVAPRIGDRVAALGLIGSTLIVFLIPLAFLTNAVLGRVNDVLEILRENNIASLEESRALLESVFSIEFNDASTILEILQTGDTLSYIQMAMDVFGGVSNASVHITILLFLWYYLLKDGDRLLEWIGRVLPLSATVQSTLVTRADKVMYVVVIGNFLVALADGVLVGLGLWIVGFPNIIFWLFVSVFLALIPLIGTMVVWVPAAVYLAISGEVVSAGFLVVYGFIVVGAVDNVLRPFLGAPDVGLEPGIFVIGVLTGLTLFGFIGIFYGPVLLVMTKVVYETVGRNLQSPQNVEVGG